MDRRLCDAAEVRAAVEAKVSGLKSTKDGSDLAAIKSALADLSAEIQKIGQAMYTDKKQDGPQPEPTPQSDSPTGN